MTGVAAIETLPARVRDRELAAMPCEWSSNNAAARELDLRQLGAWHLLRMHLYKYGELPTGLKALAAICRIGARSFERMAPALALHFDRDADGRWTDHDLVRARGGRGIVHQREAVDPDLSEKRRQAAYRSHETRRLRLVPSHSEAGCEVDGDANADGFAGESRMQTGARFAAVAGAGAGGFAAPFAPSSHGSIDRSSLQNESKTIDPSIRAREGDANSHGAAVANPQGTAVANDGADRPATPGAAPPARSLGEVDDAALIAALRPVGGGRIPAVLLNAKDLESLRVLVAEGCELERDVLPAVANFVAGLRDPLRTFGAKAIREKAIASRDLALTAAKVTAATAHMVFVAEGTPAWRAWLRAKGVRSHYSTQWQQDRTKTGWHFKSEWPEGWDAARLAAAEAPS